MGRGRFAADINFAHQLHMRVVRSASPHGKILSIDLSRALEHPGVIAAWTSSDVRDVPPIGLRDGRIEKYEPYCQPILARDRVRYVGEPVAAVFAADPYIAEDAADLVAVEIEPLPTILSPDHAPGEFSPGHSTEVTVIDKGFGDLEAGFRNAHFVIDLELKIGRHSGVPLETRGVIARLDTVRDILEMHGAAKVRRTAGELVGAGLAMFVEKSGLGPADSARVTVDTNGAVELVTGGASLGQGFETAMAQTTRPSR